jgi:hypothetical protein
MAKNTTENREVVGQNINKPALLKKCPNCGKRFDVENTDRRSSARKNSYQKSGGHPSNHSRRSHTYSRREYASEQSLDDKA